MTDWRAIQTADYAPPPDADFRSLVEELCELLASPDPVQRDELGYSVIATWLSRHVLDGELCSWLGDEMAGRLGADDVWVRTFAPLVLDALVTYGTFDPQWVSSFERWYPVETDLRGNDPELGWLHAVAHGADLLGTLGLCAEVDPVRMLEVAARRLLAPTSAIWREGEDERLGYAIALTLTRSELTTDTSVAWLAPIVTRWAERDPGPPAPSVTNAARTLRVVTGLTLTGVRPSDGTDLRELAHPTDVRTGVLAALHTLTPYMW